MQRHTRALKIARNNDTNTTVTARAEAIIRSAHAVKACTAMFWPTTGFKRERLSALGSQQRELQYPAQEPAHDDKRLLDFNVPSSAQGQGQAEWPITPHWELLSSFVIDKQWPILFHNPAWGKKGELQLQLTQLKTLGEDWEKMKMSGLGRLKLE